MRLTRSQRLIGAPALPEAEIGTIVRCAICRHGHNDLRFDNQT
jgi:hypothetical protein